MSSHDKSLKSAEGGISGYQEILVNGTVNWREPGSERVDEITVSNLHSYWKNPALWEPDYVYNKEADYLTCTERSIKLVELFKKYVPLDSHILELGCNVGRNLHFLYEAGYHNLTGIDINSNALKLGMEHYPELLNVNLICNEIKREISTYPKNKFDVIFTMATLEHIHPKEAGIVFSMMGYIAKSHIITCEDEKAVFWRAFSYRYKNSFEFLGFKELETFELLCKNEIDTSGDCTLTYRIFKK